MISCDRLQLSIRSIVHAPIIPRQLRPAVDPYRARYHGPKKEAIKVHIL